MNILGKVSTEQKRVLIIEDDRDILESLQTFLELEGYDVSIANNGRSALDLLAAGPFPDLILLDMKMPIMNGWEFAAEFHKLYPGKTPILVMTAAADADQRAKDIQADGWLGKPFMLESLASRLKELGV